MTLHIPNLDKLIAHLEAQPPERINMGVGIVKDYGSACGTCGCIAGHSELVWPEIAPFAWEDEEQGLAHKLGMNEAKTQELTHPDYFWMDAAKDRRYPAHRVIATLKRLRDRFLATGEIVVDWGPEPTEGQPWSAPQAVELSPPALPAEITRLLAPVAVTEEADHGCL